MPSHPSTDSGRRPGRGPTGAPTKLTPYIHALITNLLRNGNTRTTAAKAAGIDYTTLLNWLSWGENKGDGIYFNFFKDLQEAEAQAQISLVKLWAKHHKRDWRSVEAFLKRRWPQEWGDRTTIEVSGEVRIRHEEFVLALQEARNQLKSGETVEGEAREVLSAPVEASSEASSLSEERCLESEVRVLEAEDER